MRQGLVEEARQKATKELYAIVDAMRQTYEEKPAKAPTQEQLAVLQALKMRDSVSKDELREALNTVKGCPMAERVVGGDRRKTPPYFRHAAGIDRRHDS